MDPISTCSSCNFQTQSAWFFCPNCGKALQEKPLSTTLGKQLVIYFISFFLAPFGLGWGIQYIRSKDTKAKIVGVVAIVLTILAIGLLIASVGVTMSYYSKILNNVQDYGGLGL